jgi:hypothetical protein
MEKPVNKFEAHLLAELRTKHGADTARLPARRRSRRFPAIAGGGAALVAAIIAAVLALSATTAAPKAYAITRSADGRSLVVTLNDISQMSALNAEFVSMGLPIKAIPITPNCHSSVKVATDYLPPSMTELPGHHSMSNTVVLGTDFKPGEHEVIGARELPSGQVELRLVTLSTPGEPTCFTR